MKDLTLLKDEELIKINAGTGFAHDIGCAIREGFFFIAALNGNLRGVNPFKFADAASGPHC